MFISWNSTGGFHLLNMAENVDDILDLHANESEEDSFENTLSESNDLNLLFGEDT